MNISILNLVASFSSRLTLCSLLCSGVFDSCAVGVQRAPLYGVGRSLQRSQAQWGPAQVASTYRVAVSQQKFQSAATVNVQQ